MPSPTRQWGTRFLHGRWYRGQKESIPRLSKEKALRIGGPFAVKGGSGLFFGQLGRRGAEGVDGFLVVDDLVLGRPLSE